MLIKEALVRVSDARAYLARLLGWSDGGVTVDRALGLVELARARRAALVLTGAPADVEAAARGIHRRALGPGPLVVVDPGRAESAVRRRTLGAAAHAAGPSGTVALVVRRPPADVSAAGQLLAAGAPVLAVLGAPPVPCAAAVDVPALAARGGLANVIRGYVEDAVAELGASAELGARDLVWLASLATHGDLEEGARRIVALRAFGLTRAAASLGLTHGAISLWARRHGIPTRGAGGREDQSAARATR